MKRAGFTLAEVLITLTIIGIVAAMTIPSLISDTNNSQYRIKYKKAFSVISNVAMQLRGNNEFPYNSYSELADAFASKLATVKTCSNSRTEGCWHADNEWKNYAGTPLGSSVSGANFYWKGFVLNDGSIMSFHNSLFGTNGKGAYINFVTKVPYSAFLVIDVNGFKKPNVIGKDIFSLRIYNDRVVASGSEITNSLNPGFKLSPSTYCQKDLSIASGYQGYGCSYYALMGIDY